MQLIESNFINKIIELGFVESELGNKYYRHPSSEGLLYLNQGTSLKIFDGGDYVVGFLNNLDDIKSFTSAIK